MSGPATPTPAFSRVAQRAAQRAAARAATWAATPAASTAVFIGTFAAIAGLVVGLLAFDLSLARIDRLASDAHGASEYEDGAALLAHGHAAEAAEHFGAAVAVDRTNQRYALALARATLAEGHAADAEAMLQDLLRRAENDGAVNLAMAHAVLREGRPDEATSYFHRAIFGHWGADSTARRADARFELIDLLARRGATQQLLAELLPLQDTPPDSLALRRRLGQLFIKAGSPARGVALLRDVLARDPHDAEAYAGLGEGALALGNFRTAHADFAEAVRLRPADVRYSTGLALVDTVLALDPEARGIGAHARYERSRLQLSRDMAVVERCTGESRGTPSALLDSARVLLLAKTPRPTEDDAGEAMVALADELWSARPAACPVAGLPDQALALLHARSRQ